MLARGAAEPWLRVHGKLRRPEMSKKDAMELRECFELIDSEGSGKCSRSRNPVSSLQSQAVTCGVALCFL
jgi:hypothetical protein